MEEKKKPTPPKKKIDEETLNGLKESYGALPKALDAEKNRELLERYKETGDIEIRNQIACGNLRFAVKYAYKYFQNVVHKCYKGQSDDLINDLTISLFKAIEKFDLSKECSFSTFAGKVIRNDLLIKFRGTKALKNKAEIVSFSSSAYTFKDGSELSYEQILTDDKFTEENFATVADLKYILEKIVPTLSERERILFNELFIEGKTRSQCAKSVGLAEGSMSKAIIELRKKIVDAYQNGIETVKKDGRGRAKQTNSQDKPSFEEVLAAQTKRNQDILKDYFAGKLALKEVAAKYDMSTANVTYIVREFKYDCKLRNVEIPARVTPQSNWARQQEQRALNKQKMKQRNEAVVQDYLNGLLVREIAEKRSLTVGNVGYIVSRWKAEHKNEGKETRRTSHKTLEKKDRDNRIFADYLAGKMSVEEIGEKYSLGKRTVETIISQINAERRNNGEEVFTRRKQRKAEKILKQKSSQTQAAIKREERNEGVWADYLAGEMSVDEIAEKYSISKALVRYVVKKTKSELAQRGEIVPHKKRVRKLKNPVVLKQADQIEAAFSIDDVLALLSDKKRKIFESYQNGAGTVKDVAERLGISRAYVLDIVAEVKKRCKERGIQLPKVLREEDRKKQERNNNIWADYLKGEETLQELAKKYSMTISNVEVIISKFKSKNTEKTEENSHKELSARLKNKQVLRRVERDKVIHTFDDVLSALPDRQREIAESYLKDDCSVREIADEFGTSQSFVYKIVGKLKKVCEEQGIEMPIMSRQIVKIAVLKGFEDGTLTFEQVDSFMGRLTESQRHALYDWKEQKSQERKDEQPVETTSKPNQEKDVTDADEKSENAAKNDDKAGEDGGNGGKGDGDGKGGKGWQG